MEANADFIVACNFSAVFLESIQQRQPRWRDSPLGPGEQRSDQSTPQTPSRLAEVWRSIGGSRLLETANAQAERILAMTLPLRDQATSGDREAAISSARDVVQAANVVIQTLREPRAEIDRSWRSGPPEPPFSESDSAWLEVLDASDAALAQLEACVLGVRNATLALISALEGFE
jgi:hypothetical protein